jgi:hypothetical protein
MGQWPPQLGFYLDGHVDEENPSFHFEQNVRINFIMLGPAVCGLQMTVFGMRITILLHNGVPGDFGIWRPQKLVLFKGDQVHLITFNWVGYSSDSTVFGISGDRHRSIASGNIVATELTPRSGGVKVRDAFVRQTGLLGGSAD